MGIRAMCRPAGRFLLVAGATIGLSACSANPTTPMSYVVDGIMMLDSGKGMTDHAVSSITGRDCALFRVLRGDPICRDAHGDVVVPDGMELIVTSRRPILVAARDGAAAPAETGTRPYLTDTMIFRAAPIRGAGATQTLVAAHAPPSLGSDTVVADRPTGQPTPGAPSGLRGLPPVPSDLQVAAVTVEALPVDPRQPVAATMPVTVAALPAADLAMPLPPPRTRFLSVAAADAPLPPRRPVVGMAPPLRLASADRPPILNNPVVQTAAIADLGAVPAPPRRPGWFLDADPTATVAAAPLLAPALLDAGMAVQVADLPGR